VTRALIFYVLSVAAIAVLAGLWSLWALLGLPVSLAAAVVLLARARAEPPRPTARVIEEERW
jgi:asparagine N-glycosylation enzyme membrane subunit Stt3